MSHVGYKKCGDYVVKLKIIGENNERRLNVVDACKEYAKFRTSKAFVEEIFNLDGSVSNVSEVKSNWNQTFVYKKGELVEAKDYDKYINEICSAGIHYFLSFETAKFYGIMPLSKGYTGEWKSWYLNGQLEYQGEYKNGKREGIHEVWFVNGQPYFKGEWKNDKQEGIHYQWHENGKLWRREEWKNGVEDGIHEQWYKDGQLVFREEFRNGVYK